MGAVIVPATENGLHPSVLPALIEWGTLPTVELCSEDSDYALIVARRWRRREPFLIVEQDVEVKFNVDSLLRCDSPWCVVIYSRGHNAGFGPGSSAAMGCVKYDPVRLGSFPLNEAVAWWNLAQELHDALRFRGFHPHIHKEKVEHHT